MGCLVLSTYRCTVVGFTLAASVALLGCDVTPPDGKRSTAKSSSPPPSPAPSPSSSLSSSAAPSLSLSPSQFFTRLLTLDLPAAPYSVEAHQDIERASESVPLPTSGGEPREALKRVIAALDESYRKAGYSLQKSLVIFIDEINRDGRPPLLKQAEFVQMAYVAVLGAAEQGIPPESLFDNPTRELRARFSHFTQPAEPVPAPAPRQTARTSTPIQITVHTPTSVAPTETAAATETDGPCKGLNTSITDQHLECIGRRFKIADAQLNADYKRQMESLSAQQRTEFRDAQRKWLRDKQQSCARAAAEFEGGTLEAVVGSACHALATEKRVTELPSVVQFLLPGKAR